ncbi:MAG: hypothetical protein AAFU60_02095 [Bacteroidota bacterium]
MSTPVDLASQKNDWKIAASEDMEDVLNQLLRAVVSTSLRYEELLMLNGEYHRLDSDKRKGILDYEEQVLHTNRILVRVIDLIDLIEAPDLIGYIADPQDPPPGPMEAVAREVARLRESMGPIDNQKIISEEKDPLDALMMIEATERKAITSFPKIYRRVREIQHRKERGSKVQALVSELKRCLGVMKQFSAPVEIMDGVIRQVRIDATDPSIWLRYRKLKDFAEGLEPHQLGEISGQLAEVQAVYALVRKGGWIP